MPPATKANYGKFSLLPSDSQVLAAVETPFISAPHVEPVYDRDFFIRKFEAIPDDQIGIGGIRFHCALAWCGMRYDAQDRIQRTAQSDALVDLFGGFGCLRIGMINDGSNDSYKQPTAKARVLAALRDLQP